MTIKEALNCNDDNEMDMDWNTHLGKEFRNLVEKALYLYEKKEKGLIKEIPCNLGDTIYWVNNHYGFYNDLSVDPETVEEIRITKDGILISMGGAKSGYLNQDIFTDIAEAECQKELEAERLSAKRQAESDNERE